MPELALVQRPLFLHQAVREREATANDLAEALNDSIVGLDTWRKDKNYRLNNTEIVLAIDQVRDLQMEGKHTFLISDELHLQDHILNVVKRSFNGRALIKSLEQICQPWTAHLRLQGRLSSCLHRVP